MANPFYNSYLKGKNEGWDEGYQAAQNENERMQRLLLPPCPNLNLTKNAQKAFFEALKNDLQTKGEESWQTLEDAQNTIFQWYALLLEACVNNIQKEPDSFRVMGGGTCRYKEIEFSTNLEAQVAVLLDECKANWRYFRGGVPNFVVYNAKCFNFKEMLFKEKPLHIVARDFFSAFSENEILNFSPEPILIIDKILSTVYFSGYGLGEMTSKANGAENLLTYNFRWRGDGDTSTVWYPATDGENFYMLTYVKSKKESFANGLDEKKVKKHTANAYKTARSYCGGGLYAAF